MLSKHTREGEQLAAEMEIVVVCTEFVVVNSVFTCLFLSLLNENGYFSWLVA